MKYFQLYCLIVLFIVGCDEGELSDPLPIDQILDLQLINPDSSYLADGTTLIPIEVIVNENSTANYKIVTISSNTGKFLTSDSSSMMLNLTLEAIDTVYLIPGLYFGPFIVEIATNTTPPVRNLIPLELQPSMPETLSVSNLSTVLIDSVGGTIDVEVLGAKSNGLPSAGILIEFNGKLQDTGEAIGRFAPFTTPLNDTQRAESTWSFIEGGLPKGTIIEISASLPNSDFIISTRQIKIN